MISYRPRGEFNCEFCGEPAARAVSLQGVQYHSCIEHVPVLEKMEQKMPIGKVEMDTVEDLESQPT
jgi:hypothetical protein